MGGTLENGIRILNDQSMFIRVEYEVIESHSLVFHHLTHDQQSDYHR